MKDPKPAKSKSSLLDFILAYDAALEYSALDEADPAGTTIQTNVKALPDDEAAELDGLRECVDLLERMRLQNHANVLGVSTPSGPSELPAQIGRFRVIREIGRGGGGVVLLARDPRLGRNVALKLPHPQALVLPDLRRRFIQEAKSVASLQHSHILAVHEVGEFESVCYIASPYVDGPNLAQWMEAKAGDISIDVAVQLILQIAEAVHFAHSRGILHRDIKPSNVLLVTPVADDRSQKHQPDFRPDKRNAIPLAKLADFGLAKRIDEEHQELTQTGAILGTPMYMAPEQVEGDARSIGTHTDTWSLGVLLHELLAGTSPFAADSKAATFQRILSGEPLELASFPRRVPADLRAICRKCLQRKPADRYESVSALVADLKRFQAGVPTEARPLSAVESTFRWIRQHPTFSLCLTMLVAATLLIAVISWMSAERVRGALSETEALLFAADITLASQAIESANAKHAIELLTRHIPNGQQPDRRNFAWHYLWGLLHREEAILTMPNGAQAVGAAYTPDGRYLLTAAEGDEAVLHVWDVATSELTRTFETEQRIEKIEFGVSGQRFVTVSEQGNKVKVWRFDSSTPLTSCQFGYAFDCGDFDEERNELVTGGDDGLLQLVALSNANAAPRLLGRHDNVEDVAFSPDGQWVVSSGDDSSIKLWNRQTGECVQDEFLHSDINTKKRMRFDVIEFSPDSRMVAVGANHSDIYVWDVERREEIGHFEDHTSNIYDLAFSPDCQQLASSSKDASVRLWDLRAKNAPVVIQGHGRPVFGLCYSSDGQNVATCGKDGTVRIWNQAKSSYVESRRGKRDWSNHGPSKVAFAKFAITGDGEVQQTGIDSTKILGRHQALGCISVSPDGRYVVSSGQTLLHPTGHTDSPKIQRVDLDADGDLDAVSAMGGSDHLVWQENIHGDFQVPRLFSELEHDTIDRVSRFRGWEADDTFTVAQCERGRLVRITPNPATSDGHIYVPDWELATSVAPCDVDNDGDLDLIVAEFGSEQLRWLEYEADGILQHKHALAPFSKAYEVLAGDLDRDGDDEIFVLTAEGSRLFMLTRSQDGTWEPAALIDEGLPHPSLLDLQDVNEDGYPDLICASYEKVLWFPNKPGKLAKEPKLLRELAPAWNQAPATNVAIWDTATQQLVNAFSSFEGIGFVAMSPDSTLLATTVDGPSDVIRLWNTATGDEVVCLPPICDSGHVSDLAFSPDGKYLLFSAGNSGYIWDLEENGLLHKLVGHENTVAPVVIAPDGKRIITCSHDFTIRVWSLETGETEQMLLGHTQRPVTVCFAPDELTMATAGIGGEVILWDLVTGQQLIRLTEFQCERLHDLQFLDERTLSAVGRIRDTSGYFSKTATWMVTD